MFNYILNWAVEKADNFVVGMFGDTLSTATTGAGFCPAPQIAESIVNAVAGPLPKPSPSASLDASEYATSMAVGMAASGAASIVAGQIASAAGIAVAGTGVGLMAAPTAAGVAFAGATALVFTPVAKTIAQRVTGTHPAQILKARADKKKAMQKAPTLKRILDAQLKNLRVEKKTALLDADYRRIAEIELAICKKEAALEKIEKLEKGAGKKKRKRS